MPINWIPVAERLPPIQQEVLVRWVDGTWSRKFHVSYLAGDPLKPDWMDVDGDYWSLDTVSHWAELTEPGVSETKQIKVILEGGNVHAVEGIPPGYEVIVWDDFTDGLDDDDEDLAVSPTGKTYYEYQNPFLPEP